MQKTGKIIPHGVKPDPNELDTIIFFTNLTKDIELIPASHTPHMKRADIIMDNLIWEIKCPITNSRRAIERLFYSACQQSSNIIFNLQFIKGNDLNAQTTLQKCFQNTRRARKLYIITKSKELKYYQK